MRLKESQLVEAPDKDPDFGPDRTINDEDIESDQMRMKMDNFVAECDRYNISDRAAAALATGLLRDLGLVSDVDNKMVVDRCTNYFYNYYDYNHNCLQV